VNTELFNARKSLGDPLNDSSPLLPSDYQLFGQFVQAYCIADFEARLAINALKQARCGAATDYALRLNDKDVIEHLRIRAEEWEGEIEVREGLIKVADILGGHRHLRHIFAHWAGRRVSNHNAFIFFTASLGNQKIAEGAEFFEETDRANVQYCLVPIAAVVEELAKLQGHVQYLASMGRQASAQVEAIAEVFARARETNGSAYSER